MNFYDISAQVFGIAAFLMSALSFQAKNFKTITVFKIISYILFTVNYFMLTAYTGMISNVISCLRGFVYIWLVQKGASTKKAQILFSIIFIVFGIATWDGIICIFAIMGAVVQTIAHGTENPAKLRLINLPTCFMWMVYNTYYRSSGGLLSDIFSLISIIVAMIRLDLPEFKKRKQNKKP